MYKILLLTLLMACGDKEEDTGTDEAADTAEQEAEAEEGAQEEEGSDTGSAEQIQTPANSQTNT